MSYLKTTMDRLWVDQRTMPGGKRKRRVSLPKVLSLEGLEEARHD